jgi:hypothetical protein
MLQSEQIYLATFSLSQRHPFERRTIATSIAIALNTAAEFNFQNN